MCVRPLIVLFLFILEFVQDRRNVTDQRKASSRRLFWANFYFLIDINRNNGKIDLNKYNERVRFACRSFLSPSVFIRVRSAVLNSILVSQDGRIEKQKAAH